MQFITYRTPVPVAARSKASVFCRSPAGIAGSNPTRGMDVCLFVCCECCVLSGRSLCDGLITRPEGFYRLWRVIKTVRKQVRINRSNRWAIPESYHSFSENYVRVKCLVSLNKSRCHCKKREIEKKSHRGYGCLSVVSVVCCQVEVSATS